MVEMVGGEARAPDPAAVFAALGDPVRFDLVERLGDGRARPIASLAAGAPITRQAIARHLQVLERAGLITRAREGRESRISLDPRPLRAAIDRLAAISAQWDNALERLRAFVERN
ncbi:MAG: ArsR/SmtB family transcription factor [Caulobacteraceae bacterium]